MTKVLLIISLVVIFYANESSGRVAPDYIQPCPGQKSDCLKETIQKIIPLFSKGIPELGVNSLDPLVQSYVSLDLPGGLKIELTDGSIQGLRKCVIDSVTYENDEADLSFHCNITYKGKYKANGNILIVALNGDGDAKVKISNVIVNMKIKFGDVTRDGVVYYEVKNKDIKYRVADRVSFVLTNLFKGNPELSQTVLAFLNENWKQLVDEFGKPIFDKIVDLVYNIIKEFFVSVPKKELFP